MRLVLLLSAGRSSFGGIEGSALALAGALAERGHRVTLVHGGVRMESSAAATEIVLPVVDERSILARVLARLLRTVPLNARSALFDLRMRASRPARAALAEADAALAFFEGDAVLAARARAGGPPVVHYFYGGIDPEWARRDRSRRVAISSLVAALAAPHGVACAGVVWPGVQRSLLDAPCRADRPERPERLVVVGRLERVKRPERALAVLAALAPDWPELTLRLVGDGSLRAATESEAGRLGLASRVTITGALPASGVAAELAAADLALAPSDWETFGIAAAEAMAAGVPLLVSDLPAVREWANGDAELLAPADTAAWAAVARRLLADGALRGARSAAGRRRVATLTWERTAAELEVHLAAGRG